MGPACNGSYNKKIGKTALAADIQRDCVHTFMGVDKFRYFSY